MGVLLGMCGRFVCSRGICPLCIWLCYRGIPARLTWRIVKAAGENATGKFSRRCRSQRDDKAPVPILFVFPGISGLVSSCTVLLCYPLTVVWPCRPVFCPLSHFTPYPMHGYTPTAKINSRDVLGACAYILI